MSEIHQPPSLADFTRAHLHNDSEDPSGIHHKLGPTAKDAAPGNHDHGMTELLKRWLDSKTGTHSIPSAENPGVTVWYPSGFYDTVNNANMPTTNWYFIFHIRHTNFSNNYARQMAFQFAPNGTNYTRAIENNVPSAWAAMGF